jgi:hypothetical protein
MRSQPHLINRSDSVYRLNDDLTAYCIDSTLGLVGIAMVPGFREVLVLVIIWFSD